MRAAGNLAGVEFIAPPIWHNYRDTWAEIITESGYFFTRSAMRFFDSRVAWETLTQYGDGYLFITSEQPPAYGEHRSPRTYTLRKWTKENGTNPLSEFGEFATIDQAKRELRKRVASVTNA